jgi:hypothetical protein
MMIGVAQVIGTKPTLSLVFSSGPMLSISAALACAIGKMVARAAATVPPPSSCMKRRRLMSLWLNTARTTAFSMARSIMSSLDIGVAMTGARLSTADCCAVRPVGRAMCLHLSHSHWASWVRPLPPS